MHPKRRWTTLHRALSARIIEELKKIYSPEELDVALSGWEPGSVVFKFRHDDLIDIINALMQ